MSALGLLAVGEKMALRGGGWGLCEAGNAKTARHGPFQGFKVLRVVQGSNRGLKPRPVRSNPISAGRSAERHD